MQSKNRSLRVLALVQTVGLVQQALANPFTTMADGDLLGEHLRDSINAVLDHEYQQGYTDGAYFGASVAADLYEDELQ